MGAEGVSAGFPDTEQAGGAGAGGRARLSLRISLGVSLCPAPCLSLALCASPLHLPAQVSLVLGGMIPARPEAGVILVTDFLFHASPYTTSQT